MDIDDSSLGLSTLTLRCDRACVLSVSRKHNSLSTSGILCIDETVGKFFVVEYCYRTLSINEAGKLYLVKYTLVVTKVI